MPNLLLVTHCPSENTQRLRDAAVKGIKDLGEDSSVILKTKNPLQAGAEDVLWADAILLGSTENFGYMAGLIKDFFERIYYPCLDKTQGLAFALYIRAGEDGQGTVTSIERIVTGLRWKVVQPPMVLKGRWDERFKEQVEELGLYMAAGLDAKIF